MASIHFFFYGTLKRGFSNNGLLAGQEFICQALTMPAYRLYDRGPFPCLIPAATGGRAIEGELWRVQEALLPRLDELEEAPHLFERRPVALPAFSAPVVAYFYNGDLSECVDCGTSWPPS
jgi:gamma-glutamylaminecyclotransferase